MGATYQVDYELRFNNVDDERNAMEALREYLRIRFMPNTNDINNCTTLNGLMEIICRARIDNTDYHYHKGPVGTYYFSSGFDAPYYWEQILQDTFTQMTEYLSDNSRLTLWPDVGMYRITKFNGEIYNSMSADLKKLTIEDRENVQWIDSFSGNGVCTKSTIDNDGCSAYGLFFDGEMIGYCTLNKLDGSANEDGVMLSDIFILPGYRSFYFSMEMMQQLMDVADGMEGNIYVVADARWKEDYFEVFGFEPYDEIDHIMVREG